MGWGTHHAAAAGAGRRARRGGVRSSLGRLPGTTRSTIGHSCTQSWRGGAPCLTVQNEARGQARGCRYHHRVNMRHQVLWACQPRLPPAHVTHTRLKTQCRARLLGREYAPPACTWHRRGGAGCNPDVTHAALMENEATPHTLGSAHARPVRCSGSGGSALKTPAFGERVAGVGASVGAAALPRGRARAHCKVYSHMLFSSMLTPMPILMMEA